jgi:hypothetical protein
MIRRRLGTHRFQRAGTIKRPTDLEDPLRHACTLEAMRTQAFDGASVNFKLKSIR